MTRRPAHPRRRPVAPGQRPTRAARHPFHADADVPADYRGRQYCATCSCHGEAGDAKHHSDDETAAKAAANREFDERKLGERH